MSDRPHSAAQRAAGVPAPIGEILAPIVMSLGRRQQVACALREALVELLPQELAAEIDVVTLRGKTVTVAVRNAATKCLLEAEARRDLMARLRQALPGQSVRRLRVVLTAGDHGPKIIE